MENATLSFTIILSFVGIVISIASLVFAIVYLIKITKLEKTQEELLKIKNISETIKRALVSRCVLFGQGGKKMLSGEEVIKEICERYHCDEWVAISIFTHEHYEKCSTSVNDANIE